MGTYCIAQVTLLSALWWPKWEDNPKKRECMYIYRRRQWHPTPVLLPGKSHGRRSLVGCSPWGCWGSDTTERLHFHFSLSCIGEGNGNPLQCSCLQNPRDGGAWWLPSMGSHRVGHDWSDLAATSACIYIRLPRWCSGKESVCQQRRQERRWLDPCMGKIP